MLTAAATVMGSGNAGKSATLGTTGEETGADTSPVAVGGGTHDDDE